MITIHILSPGFTNPNSCAFLFPFFAFKKTLKDAGLNIKIFTKPCESLSNCDLLVIEYKSMSKTWDEIKSPETLIKWREQTKIIWCDQSDSTGTFFGQVLPYVDKYLKAQKLRDTPLYKKTFYGDRIYTNYYHQKQGINDEIHYDYTPAKTKKDLQKIGVSWNSGLMNHGPFGPYYNRALEQLPSAMLTRFATPSASPSSERHINVACRMGISYPRATARFQREQIKKVLSQYIATNKLSRRAYYKELANSKICASPFGYGEITLKDFESFLTGTALLKPNMDHLETWPNFYQKDKTYIAHNWDLDDLNEVIEKYLDDDEKRIEIASNGQEIFKQHTTSKDAAAIFCGHFQQLIKI